MSAGLRVTGIRKSYAAVPVLRGIELTVPSGGLTAVVGPSGCGKTTLLRVVAGFERPAAGTIVLGDRDVTALPPERRRIGYVTQEGNLFPHVTVAGNITFGLPWRARRARQRVPELLELLGLDPSLADRYPHQLSGGQQQRVALARALAPGPALLLLDEPFSALDAELRASTRRAVADALAATHTTTVLVTHDQSEALSLAARVAVLRDGRILQEGTPTELYQRPVDHAVAAFFGNLVTLPAVVDDATAHTPLGPLAVADAAGGHGASTVLLRPEQIEITPPTAGATTAVVRDVAFHGHDGFVELLTDDGATPLTARCAGHRLPAIGDRVGVRVSGDVMLGPGGHGGPDPVGHDRRRSQGRSRDG